ncbi:amidoligase family protein [Oscillibacter sp.]|uniref:amidoligase family protein n=1 Tax=Oscillibacter sp. TaxID=1945593 RepID=UPI002D80802A|nr:amidoligase family protein [Oscillibacter sp.]
MIGMKEQCFGVEIEMTGITREEAAHILADYFGTTPRHWGRTYDAWVVKDLAGKEWKLMSDSSIHPECLSEDGYLRLDKDSAEGGPYKVEMVTPKLAYRDLTCLQECMRQLTAMGAKVNDSCGLHVHVDASNHNRQSLKNLIGIMYSKEDLLFKALRVNEARAIEWCQKVREPMLKKARTLSAEETPDLTQLENIWYEGFENDGRTRRDHYNKSRYYALNLHSVFYRGTVEWRCFNSTLDPAKAAAYVNLCLAMSAQAIAQRSTVMKKTRSDNELFTFRVWLVRLGLNGDEFKETRDILLANLEGDRAWRRDKDSYEVNRRKKKQRENVR